MQTNFGLYKKRIDVKRSTQNMSAQLGFTLARLHNTSTFIANSRHPFVPLTLTWEYLHLVGFTARLHMNFDALFFVCTIIMHTIVPAHLHSEGCTIVQILSQPLGVYVMSREKASAPCSGGSQMWLSYNSTWYKMKKPTWDSPILARSFLGISSLMTAHKKREPNARTAARH